MSKDPEPSSSGLLSRVVKFVKSPTTHWADLDRPDTETQSADSRLALKEMIERKRRNDFVRNREFDMLRKLRQREGLVEREAGAHPSFAPSSQLANTGERARTLKKIDEIEAQMSHAWFKRKTGASSASAALGASAPATTPDLGHAYDKTKPAPLRAQHPPPAQAPVQPPVQSPVVQATAFSPTKLLEKTLPPTVPMPEAPAAAAVAQPPASLPVHIDPHAEAVVEVEQDAEIEEAAIRFANGDAAGAEASLLQLLGEGGTRAGHVGTWLVLFDLYRANGEQDKFDDVAVGFASRFGRSAPQWSAAADQGGATASAGPAAAAPANNALVHWTAPSSIGVQSVAALNATLARNASPWKIDWRYVKTIEPAALPALKQVFQRWATTRCRLKFLGGEHLTQLLADRSPTDDRSVDQQWWLIRLALLRVMGEMDEFELVALNYCVTYEVSPPAWEKPLNNYSAMSPEGVTLQPSEAGDGTGASPSQQPSGFPSTQIPTALPGASGDPGIFKADLQGELLGDAEDVLRALLKGHSFNVIELNCRRLRRVDFGAAGTLLNWSIEQKALGHQVVFKQLNRLVAAFFGVVGVNEAARVMVRVD